MSLSNYDPFIPVRQLQSEINRLFSGLSTDESSSVTADWVPRVDIDEFDDKYQLYVDVPGVEPRNVEITLETGILTISGERLGHSPAGDESVARRLSERGTGRFHRRFILPETVDADNVKAAGRHGVLEIEIPKQAKAKPRRIEVAG